VFFLLERRGFECLLYNPGQVKAQPGRPKTDPLTELQSITAGQGVLDVRHVSCRVARSRDHDGYGC